MSFVNDTIISEGLLSGQTINKGTLVTAVTASTITLTVTSVFHQIFTGNTAGQIIKMQDCTTFTAIGQEQKITNDSTQNITIQDSAAGALFLLAPGQRALLSCVSIASAAGGWSYEITGKSLSGSSDFATVYPGTGLTVNYQGGVFRFNGVLTQVAGGSIALPASTTAGKLYVDVDAVVKATASLPDGASGMYTFTTTTDTVTSLIDIREVVDNNDTYGIVDDISAITTSNSVAAGTLNKSARADHVHASTLPLYKSGIVAAVSFTGNPRSATVVLDPAFPGVNYSVVITGCDGRAWIVPDATRLAGSFVINAQAAAALTGPVYWHAIAHGASL